MEWELNSKVGHGQNTIRAVLDGCAIEEEFNGTPSMRLRGKSLSLHNIKSGKWRQTWVDNEGSYLDFIGEFKDGKMVLQRRATKDGKEMLQRMVWFDIAPNSLTWNWERSDDEGTTWTVLWQIKYARKK